MAEDEGDHPDVRARLAAEPIPSMPPEVAARLQAAIREEADQRADSADPAATEPATVTPLRRRRWHAPLLAAACVVAVVAVGIPVIDQVSDDTDTGGASSSMEADDDYAGEADGDSAPQNSAPSAAPPSEVPTLRTNRFAADVERKLLNPGQMPDATVGKLQRTLGTVRCSEGVPASTEGVSVLLDGEPAVVIATTSQAGSGTTVRAVQCGPNGPQVSTQATVRD